MQDSRCLLVILFALYSLPSRAEHTGYAPGGSYGPAAPAYGYPAGVCDPVSFSGNIANPPIITPVASKPSTPAAAAPSSAPATAAASQPTSTGTTTAAAPSGGATDPVPGAPSAGGALDGKALFEAKCASCHKPSDVKRDKLSQALNHEPGVKPMPQNQPQLSEAERSAIQAFLK